VNDGNALDPLAQPAAMFLYSAAHDDRFVTIEGRSVNGNVFNWNPSIPDIRPGLAVVEVNGQAVVGSQVTLASGALLMLNRDGTFSYEQNGAFDSLAGQSSGASNIKAKDSFTYTLAGGATATVTIVIRGIDSDDLVRGTAGADTLFGGVGDDRMMGLAGADEMRGGTGNDRYYVDDRDDLVLEASGEGTDTIYSTVTRTLGADIEHLYLKGNGDINGAGNDLANAIYGSAGANSLSGKSGNDTLSGADGNDRLDGGTGEDVMRGGIGDDIYYVDAAGDATLENASEGTDTVFSTITRKLGDNLENLRLLGADDLSGFGNALANAIYGNTGANVLRGREGDDWLEGGDGNDTLDGGTGADSMRGGAGNDLYMIDDVGDRTVETIGLGGGIDTVESSVERTLGENFENLILTGVTNIAGYGNTLANVITGNAGHNLLNGRDGDDTLTGAGGDDTLVGGAGKDLLIGGKGNDLLNGGSDADTFRFATSGAGIDTINAFSAAEDRFDLSGGSFTGLSVAGGNTTLTHNGGRIIIFGVTGLTLEGWNDLVLPPGTIASLADMPSTDPDFMLG
jgi:VCBS repeat-containing protein